MRRNRVLKRLSGQLLLVDADSGGVTVDGLLESSEGEAVLVTLSFSVDAPDMQRVLDVLCSWEGSGASVHVSIGEGPRGPQVTMSSGKQRLALAQRW